MGNNKSSPKTAIQQALEIIANGISERKATEDFRVPRSTLYIRRTGQRNAGQEGQQWLSQTQGGNCVNG